MERLTRAKPPKLSVFLVMDKCNYWINLLMHYEKHHYYQNGLTIPFLIGARTYLENGKRLLSVLELLDEIQNSPAAMTIMKCSGINEYVIGLMDYESKKLKNIYKSFGSLFLTDQSFSNANDISNISIELESLYRVYLKEERFSKVDGLWIQYNETDKKRFAEVNMG